MPEPISAWLPPIASDPIWLTATDSLHINTASGAWLVFWLIPCPTWIYILSTQGCWVPTAVRTRPICQNVTQAADAHEWHRVLSPHSGTVPRLAIWCLQSRCQSLVTPALHCGLRTGFTAPAYTSSLPHCQFWIFACAGLSSWDIDEPTHCTCSWHWKPGYLQHIRLRFVWPVCFLCPKDKVAPDWFWWETIMVWPATWQCGKGLTENCNTAGEMLIVSEAWLICHLQPDSGVDKSTCAAVGVLRWGFGARRTEALKHSCIWRQWRNALFEMY